MTRYRRGWTALGIAAVVIAGAAWGLHRFRAGPEAPDGPIVLAGLQAPAEVLWDSLGIPHVFAASRDDALRVQGWVHGRDRLWQVELFRRVARGRLAEVFGEPLLATDRFLRTLGLARAAERSAELLDEPTRAALLAYLEGLNAAVTDPDLARPPEFRLLGLDPTPFTLVDALAIEKIMAWDLAEYERTLDLTDARARLGPEAWERVRPRYPADAPTILDDAPSPSDTPAAADGRFEGAPPDPVLVAAARLPRAGRAFVEAANTVRASNAWVVGGDRSASGRPLLANDMHLGLDAPPIWYLVGLHAPGFEVVGMSLPGAPGVVAGHNRAVAWGFTNATLDDTDLFVERLHPSDSTRYLTPEGSRPFETRLEVIAVRGAAPDSLRVRVTRHGPIVTPVEARAGGELLALRWAGHDPSPTFRALLALDTARSVAQVVAALEDFRDPHQNVVFADTAGAWGYWMAGRIPDRPGVVPPILPVPGWTGEHDWRGYLPFDLHPHTVAARAGFVATANHRQGRGPVSDRVAPGTWAEPYRAERITEVLAGSARHDAAGMLELQLDVTSTFARALRPAAVAAFRDAGLGEQAAGLEAWDLRATLDSRAAPLFHAWFEALRVALRLDLYGGARGYVPDQAVVRALNDGFLGTGAREAAAHTAVERVGGRTWAESHRLTLDHPLASLPLLRVLGGFGRRDIPREGGPHTVNVAEFGGEDFPWAVTHGPSQRHVVDLADPDGAGGFILPGGQSGWPGSRHHDDQLERWLAGELVPVPLARTAVQARTVARTAFAPPEGSP